MCIKLLTVEVPQVQEERQHTLKNHRQAPSCNTNQLGTSFRCAHCSPAFPQSSEGSRGEKVTYFFLLAQGRVQTTPAHNNLTL